MEIRLADQIVNRPPREMSGSLASNRFDFQKDWVVCQILELHLLGKDYLVVCDYHEDVIIFDSETDPNSASFIQIKSKSGGFWTLNRLISFENERKGSILGKLYLNYVNWPEHTVNLHFISNAYYNFRLQDGSNSKTITKIECKQLNDSEVQKLRHNLTKELRSECTLPDKPALFFEVTALTTQDPSAYAKGKLVDFLSIMFPGRKHAVKAAYQVLFDEVRHKTNHEGQCSSFDELVQKKGIGPSIITRLMAEIAAYPDPDEIWGEVRGQLVHEGVSPWDVRPLRSAWVRYEVQRMDASNDVIQQLRGRILSWCEDILATNPKVTLRELMDLVWQLAQQHAIADRYLREDIHAIALMESYGKE